jgi:hypothetical protein
MSFKVTTNRDTDWCDESEPRPMIVLQWKDKGRNAMEAVIVAHVDCLERAVAKAKKKAAL